MSEKEFKDLKDKVDKIYDMMLEDRMDFKIRIDRLEQSKAFSTKLVFACVTWLLALSAIVAQGSL